MQETLTLDTKETMRENAHSLVEIMILEQHPFRLVLWNNDNWNEKLPESIMKSFPNQLVLNIKEMALQESYIDESTGEIIIATIFNEREYVKVLAYDEIIAILDMKGQPFILNDFVQEEKKEHNQELPQYVPTTVDELVKMAMSEGIPEENAKRSINAFMRNNPDLKERFKA